MSLFFLIEYFFSFLYDIMFLGSDLFDMMFIDQIMNNSTKINSKDELVEMLKRYRGILDSTVFEYFNFLLNLDFSAVSNYITDDERASLSELVVYKKIARFNIYNRALLFFKENESRYHLYCFDDNVSGLSFYSMYDKKSIPVFSFNYLDNSNYISPTNIFDGFVPMSVGKISLFQTIENSVLKVEELRRIKKSLSRQYLASIPNDADSSWYVKNLDSIKSYTALQNKVLEGYKKDDFEIEVTNFVHDYFINDFGLDESTFYDEKKLNYIFDDRFTTILDKKLVKKIPSISIENNIKYVK